MTQTSHMQLDTEALTSNSKESQLQADFGGGANIGSWKFETLDPVSGV